jgi:hypothetical protein
MLKLVMTFAALAVMSMSAYAQSDAETGLFRSRSLRQEVKVMVIYFLEVKNMG